MHAHVCTLSFHGDTFLSLPGALCTVPSVGERPQGTGRCLERAPETGQPTKEGGTSGSECALMRATHFVALPTDSDTLLRITRYYSRQKAQSSRRQAVKNTSHNNVYACLPVCKCLESYHLYLQWGHTYLRVSTEWAWKPRILPLGQGTYPLVAVPL